MTKVGLVIVGIGWMLCVGCKSQTKGADERAASESPAAQADRAHELSNERAFKSVETILLVASLDADAAQAAQPFEMTLNRNDVGQVDGQGTLEGTPLRFSGVVQDGQLRVWVRGGEGNIDSVRRGYVIGTLSEGGGFVISGNGGTPIFKGSWERQ